MKNGYSKEFKLGLTAIFCAVVLIFGVNYLKGVNIFKPDNYYFIEMKNVQGLANSAPVTIDGFKVGLIREISYNYNKPGNILVEISVDKELKIPTGSKFEMETDLMGTSSFAIKLNNHVSTYYKVGDTIEGLIGSGLMDDITDKMLPKIDQMLPKIDSIITNLNMILEEAKIKETMISINGLALNLEKSSESLARLMKNDIPQIASNLKVTTDNFAKISEDVNKINFEELYLSVNNTLNNVNKIANDISSENGTIGLLLKNPSLYNNLNSTVSHIDSLMIDLKKNPKRYVHFSVFGKK